MSKEHFIVGKDASLEAAIHSMQARLAALGFELEERSWLNPVEGIWSVHVRERECPLLFTNGKGATKLAALASALGEFFERLGTNYFWTHYYLGADNANAPFAHYPQERWFALDKAGGWPGGLLTPELRAFYDPDGTLDLGKLVDLNTGNAARGICAIPYQRQNDGATVWFPVNLIGNLYVSNGMSAGNTPTEARTQALSEIFERHVKFRIIAEGVCLPEVPAEVIARYPRIAAGVAALREAGFSILVKDASLGGQYPVMCVTLLNPGDQGCYASFGAHPRFEVALERALTELLQGRALDALAGFPPPAHDPDEVASPQNLEAHFVDSSGLVGWGFLGAAPDHEFSHWNFSGSTAEECDWLVGRVHASGREVYIADFTHLGVYVCRIIVPGMSEIYPVEDLEWENNSIGNQVRDALLRLPQLDDDACAELLETLDDLGLDELRPIAPLIGLAADAGPWAELRVGEVRLLLGLALGDAEVIREGCDWIRHFGQGSETRRRVYRCIEDLLNLEQDAGYEAALLQLYGTGTLRQAQALLSGAERFFGLHAPGPMLEGCAMHQCLLAAYAKVQQAKSR